MSSPICPGDRTAGGVVSYPSDQLLGEVAFIAYHFHWGMGEIMELEHADRRRWVSEISAIHQEMNESFES